MVDNQKGKRQDSYYFKRSQLLLLALGFTVTSVIIFLLGILIGKGIEERKSIRQEEPLVKIPVQPPAPGAKPGAQGKEEMTFYDTLSKAPPTQLAEKAAEKAPPAPSPTKEKPSVEKAPAVTEAKKEAPAQKASKVEPAKTDAAQREGPWTVQINAYPNDRDAKELAKKLKDKGYDAYVTSTKVKGRTWYRVRVGHFDTREQAQQLQETLKQKENLTKTITASR